MGMNGENGVGSWQFAVDLQRNKNVQWEPAPLDLVPMQWRHLWPHVFCPTIRRNIE